MKFDSKRIKMIDIAQEAGVSITTVSHVINKTRKVKYETAKKVMAAVKKFNYFKSIPASALRGKKTKLVGLIIPDVSNPIMAKLSRDIEEIFYKEGYNITICNSHNNLEKEIFYINALLSRYVDAIIILPVKQESKYLQIVLDNLIPLIIIDREVNSLNANFILVDNFKGFYEATHFLIDNGHSKIGYIERPYDLSHNKERFRGYIKALNDNNLKFEKKYWLRSSGFRYLDGYKAMRDILNRDDLPTAILCFDDVMALGGMLAITEAGFKIPEDFSIIGFDDTAINKYLFKSLSSVAWPTKKIADESVKILLKKIDTNHPKEKIFLKPILNIRDSVTNIKTI
jgi:DNA-binding LacI/PurR family transcriptional regulator